MKVKVHWETTVEGISEIEVDEAEVLAWVNDRVPPERSKTEVDGRMVKDFLESGDEGWTDKIEIERDTKPKFWVEYDIEKVEVPSAD